MITGVLAPEETILFKRRITNSLHAVCANCIDSLNEVVILGRKPCCCSKNHSSSLPPSTFLLQPQLTVVLLFTTAEELLVQLGLMRTPVAPTAAPTRSAAFLVRRSCCQTLSLAVDVRQNSSTAFRPLLSTKWVGGVRGVGSGCSQRPCGRSRFASDWLGCTQSARSRPFRHDLSLVAAGSHP